MLGQVEARTADDAAYWLAGASPAWRDAVRVVAIDMCAICASAVRRMLPGVVIAVDLFHVVHLAVKTLADVRRRAIRAKCGRRGKTGDPEYGIKTLLARNLGKSGQIRSPRSSTLSTPTRTGNRSPWPGSPRRSCGTR
jgi:transposase